MEKYLNWITALLFGVYTGTLIGCVIVNSHYQKEHQTKPIPQTETITDNRQFLNTENVRYWIDFFDIKYPEIVLAQSIQECGWQYSSYRAEKLHNIFGFQTADTNVLTFGHWIGSVIYYKKWQETYYQGGDYLIFLKEYKYAEDSLYCEKLAGIIKQLEAE